MWEEVERVLFTQCVVSPHLNFELHSYVTHPQCAQLTGFNGEQEVERQRER